MEHRAIHKDGDIRRSPSDIGEDDALLLLLVLENGFRRRKGRKDQCRQDR